MINASKGTLIGIIDEQQRKIKDFRSKLWDIVGECGSGLSNEDKIQEIEILIHDGTDRL